MGQLIKLSGLLFSEEGFDYLDGVVAVEVSRLPENSLPRLNDTSNSSNTCFQVIESFTPVVLYAAC